MPSELVIGLNTVAVRAPDITLGDFFHERFDRVALVLHFADVVFLHATHVVKLHHARVGVAAIYARMFLQVFPNDAPHPFKHNRIAFVGLVNVILLVVPVMATAILQVTLLARLLVLPAPDAKYRQQAELAAFGTSHSSLLVLVIHELAPFMTIADCTRNRREMSIVYLVFLDNPCRSVI